MILAEAMESSSEDRELVAAAQADPARFAEIYESHFYLVYAYVVRRVGDRAHAEDVTSEVFHDAFAGLHGFEWRKVPFRAWLLRIAQRAVADHWSKRGRDSGVAIEPEPVNDDTEQRAQMFQLVDRLPEAQYRTIHMRFVEQKSIREIAVELNRSEGAVKQLQQRAIENLRKQWEEGAA
jgi:RNA polymerase sigma-70 factor (ECF subfamily)